MKILVACEESQAVTTALRKLGHEASEWLELADLIESLQAQLAESQRRERAATEERDTMMRRHSNQVEVIRQRIDAGGLTCEESWLLRELMLETRYDRRGPQEAVEESR